MTDRDAVLRGLVFQAFELRDYLPGERESGSLSRLSRACEHIAYVAAIWPAIAAQPAIERATAELEQHRSEEEAELLAWYRAIGVLDPDEELARAA